MPDELGALQIKGSLPASCGIGAGRWRKGFQAFQAGIFASLPFGARDLGAKDGQLSATA